MVLFWGTVYFYTWLALHWGSIMTGNWRRSLSFKYFLLLNSYIKLLNWNNRSVFVISIISVPLPWIRLIITTHHWLINLWTVVIIAITMLATQSSIILLIRNGYVPWTIAFGRLIHDSHWFIVLWAFLLPRLLVLLVFLSALFSIMSFLSIIGGLVWPG